MSAAITDIPQAEDGNVKKGFWGWGRDVNPQPTEEGQAGLSLPAQTTP